MGSTYYGVPSTSGSTGTSCRSRQFTNSGLATRSIPISVSEYPLPWMKAYPRLRPVLPIGHPSTQTSYFRSISSTLVTILQISPTHTSPSGEGPESALSCRPLQRPSSFRRLIGRRRLSPRRQTPPLRYSFYVVSLVNNFTFSRLTGCVKLSALAQETHFLLWFECIFMVNLS